jgi:hypothetical protein
MKPIQFEEANISMKAPEGWTDDECGALPTCHVRVKINDKVVNGFVSCWQPTPEEMKDIADGKPVYLTVLSGGMPPVNIDTVNPVFLINENAAKCLTEALT